jgi:ribosomal protein S18 acetylase RimI-like enzyme
MMEDIEAKSGMIFVARTEGRVAGFIAFWLENEDNVILKESARKHGYISDVWVASDLRDRGLFKNLLTQVKEQLAQFPDVSRSTLKVAAHNTQAIAAYTREGFKPLVIEMSMPL